MPLGRQIQDCQAAIPQPDFNRARLRTLNNHGAAIIRPAMRQGFGRPLENVGRNRRIETNHADNSAHSLASPPQVVEMIVEMILREVMVPFGDAAGQSEQFVDVLLPAEVSRALNSRLAHGRRLLRRLTRLNDPLG